jgi:hypothetical protein
LWRENVRDGPSPGRGGLLSACARFCGRPRTATRDSHGRNAVVSARAWSHRAHLTPAGVMAFEAFVIGGVMLVNLADPLDS